MEDTEQDLVADRTRWEDSVDRQATEGLLNAFGFALAVVLFIGWIWLGDYLLNHGVQFPLALVIFFVGAGLSIGFCCELPGWLMKRLYPKH